jgi:hypothetical protein
LELWNLEKPLADSLADALASVDSDGTVFWSRPGHLRAVCKFQGLDEFPFDHLTCILEIGSWAYSGLHIRPTKMDGIGYSIGGSETAGEAYAEYTLQDVVCEEKIYPPYQAAPEEEWPVIFYHVTFDRAWEPYARGFLAMQIVLNLIAFLCFWIPPQCGERMGLAITAILAAVAAELVVSSNLPAASEITWFAKFSLTSMAFASAALFESAAVIFFHYHTGDDLKPDWVKWFMRRGKPVSPNELTSRAKTAAKTRYPRTMDALNDDEEEDSPLGALSTLPSIKEEPAQEVESAEDTTPPTSPESVRSKSGRIISWLGMVEDKDTKVPESVTNDPPPSPKLRRSSYQEYSNSLPGSTWTKIKTILGQDADDYKNGREMANNYQWQQVGRNIDHFSRVFFPVAYAICLAVLFS